MRATKAVVCVRGDHKKENKKVYCLRFFENHVSVGINHGFREDRITIIGCDVL